MHQLETCFALTDKHAGDVEFMRAFAEQTYGVPPEQVIGSSGRLKFELRDAKPVLLKLPEADFVNENKNEGRAELRM